MTAASDKNAADLDKRIKKRYPPTLYVSVYLADGGFFGPLADLSDSGFKLSSNSEIPLQQELRLAIKNPFSPQPGELREFTVKAVWCHRNQDGLYEAGFQFVECDQQSQQLIGKLTEDFDATARAINALEKDSDTIS